MTEAQRKRLERRLLEERARIAALLARYRESARVSEQDQDGDLSAFPMHPADEGTDNAGQELEAAVAARESATLDEIDEALRRMYRDPEGFGRCDVDGRAIPYARLELVPWARTCQLHEPPDRRAAVHR